LDAVNNAVSRVLC